MKDNRFTYRIREILSVRETPHKVAITFAAGLFLGISPFIGIHTLMALLLAWAFRLNKAVIISGVYVTNPWSMVPIYTFCTWVGMLLVGTDEIIIGPDWKNMQMADIYSGLGGLIKPFVVGTFLVGTVCSVLGYFIVLAAVKMMHRRSGISEEPE